MSELLGLQIGCLMQALVLNFLKIVSTASSSSAAVKSDLSNRLTSVHTCWILGLDFFFFFFRLDEPSSSSDSSDSVECSDSSASAFFSVPEFCDSSSESAGAPPSPRACSLSSDSLPTLRLKLSRLPLQWDGRRLQQCYVTAT